MLGGALPPICASRPQVPKAMLQEILPKVLRADLNSVLGSPEHLQLFLLAQQKVPRKLEELMGPVNLFSDENIPRFEGIGGWLPWPTDWLWGVGGGVPSGARGLEMGCTWGGGEVFLPSGVRGGDGLHLGWAFLPWEGVGDGLPWPSTDWCCGRGRVPAV